MNPSSHDEKTNRFRALHQPGAPFVIPNPWDAGSARILEGLGFKALATTSSGFALTKGRRDYGVTRQEALDHCRDIASAVDIAVTADLENGFGASPDDASETIRLAAQTGLCGGSIEDASGDKTAPVFEQSLAVERIARPRLRPRERRMGLFSPPARKPFCMGKAISIKSLPASRRLKTPAPTCCSPLACQIWTRCAPYAAPFQNRLMS